MSSLIWMKPAAAIDPPYLCVYRSRFKLEQETRLEFDYSADERCQLFCDGKFITSGPERGTPQRWFSNHVSILLPAGKHCLTAAVYCFGPTMTACGQMSVRHGFLLKECGGPVLGAWEYQLAAGCAFVNTKTDWASYPHILTDESFNWEIFIGKGGEWRRTAQFEDQRCLESGALPSIISEVEIMDFDRVGNIFLFHNYVTVWGEYEFSGNGEVRLRWAEPGCDAKDFTPGFLQEQKPGDAFSCFSGPGDRFRIAGKQVRWNDYFWHAGRTLEITLFGDVRLESVRFRRSGYPWKLHRELEIPDAPALSRLLKRSWRTLEACTAETMMDCPYYEQLQYIFDTRLTMLSLVSVTDDVRLIEKALRQFAEGQYCTGAMSCRYPTREAAGYTPEFGELYRTHIPSFTALWIQMVHDYARLRRNDELIRSLLPSVRQAAAYLSGYLDEDALLHVPGWNFIDWLENWEAGFPPECGEGTGCTLNLIFIRSLKDLADLERVFGLPEVALQADCAAARLEKAVRKAYYLPERNCFAENRSRTYISEHAQIWALLALGETCVIPVLENGGLDECGIAFSFYYLAACKIFDLDELFRKRFEKYLTTAADPQLMTMPEVFPNDWWLRSNCHAWSAHAIYWQFGSGSILDHIPVLEKTI